ncbi:MAG: type VI secretion system baseplate subunit TssK [Myxococcales bacterium]|nr:type VI secretion system baseplate subunit TssK [Myxococcales bacterium]
MKPRKLLWNEGLFVTQHHFQQLDRYHETLLTERVRATNRYDWGVVDIEIDERALATGALRVTRLVGILPDGTPIACGDGFDDIIPPRPLESAFGPQVKQLDVFIALPDEVDNAPNLDPDPKQLVTSRYIRGDASVLDYNTGTTEQPMSWARRTVRLLFGEEHQEAMVVMRIGQVMRGPTGAMSLRTDVIPPVLRIGASTMLMTGFSRLLSRMTGKQRALAETRKQRTEAAVEFLASDATKFWLLNALNLWIPVFSHLVEEGRHHPSDAYVSLGQLIGQLCTFAVDGDPSAIPRFDYLELGDVFRKLFDRAEFLLEAVIAEKYTEIELKKREDGMYLGNLPDPSILQHEFFVGAQGSIGETALRDKLPRLSKIASWNQISSILNSAVNGAKLELEYRPPGALPVRGGMVFFRVQKTPEFWSDIVTTGTIALYQPIEPSAVTLTLYAVDPSSLK